MSFVSILIIISTVAGAWLIGLSIVVFKINNQFKSLTKDVKDVNLIKALEFIVSKEKENTTGISDLKKEVERIDKNIAGHIQKVGFVRFNPFAETGGDQSFALSLLDKELTGYIITGLHSRDKTRIYVKPINKGKCKYNLSSEEKKSITSAN